MSTSYQNYYELLDVAQDANLEEIQAAYHKAKSLYAPDSPAIYSMFSKEEAQALISEIDKAYSTLSKPNSRQEYDFDLSGTPRPDTEYQQQVDSDAVYGLSGEFDNATSALATQELGLDSREPTQSIDAPGVAHTRFSSYSLDPEIELYIENEDNIEGDFLKTVREYRNVNLDQLSSFTKIGKHHIRAIESNDYKSLPPLVFAKGFVKQIADLLGLDGKKCADSYTLLMKQHSK